MAQKRGSIPAARKRVFSEQACRAWRKARFVLPQCPTGNSRSSPRVIEQSHVLYGAHPTRGADKRTIVVRGGCDLRFCHRSIRYSESMDLDVDRIEPHILRDKVRAVLTSRPGNLNRLRRVQEPEALASRRRRSAAFRLG